MTMRIDEADFLLELKAIEAESIGWLPLEQGVYLHCKQPVWPRALRYIEALNSSSTSPTVGDTMKFN